MVGRLDGWTAGRPAGRVLTIIIPLCGPILQAETCQIFSLAEIQDGAECGNIFQIVKYLLTEDLRYTSCSCLPPYSLYIPSIIWSLPGECPYHVLLGWLKISISSQIISALPSLMFLGVCDDILINLNPFGVFPTARIAHEKFQDP